MRLQIVTAKRNDIVQLSLDGVELFEPIDDQGHRHVTGARKGATNWSIHPAGYEFADGALNSIILKLFISTANSMNLIRAKGLAAIGRVSLFVAIGALLGYIQMLLETRLDETPEFQPDDIKVLFASVLVQCLIIIAALASWKFAVGDTYWKAPVLYLLVYFLVFLSALLMRVFLDVIVGYLNDLPDGGAQLRALWRATTRFIETRPAWGVLLVVLLVGVIVALDVFATFAFVIRAMIVRSGKWAGLVFLLIGTIAGSCLTLSVDFANSLLQSPFLLGLSALAFQVLPTKSSAPTIQTHLVEAR